MMPAVTTEVLEEIRNLGTCAVSNAIERFKVRLRTEGFTDSSIRCIFPRRPAIIGYAATGRIRSDTLPITEGAPEFLDRTDWWDYVLSIPEPRIPVLQDIDPHPGRGAFWGEVHANVHLRLGCVGAVTNGAVRYLDQISPTGFQLFAGSISVSHGYVHFVDFGGDVHIGGLPISSRDLILADQHGVLLIPQDIAAEIPVLAREIESQKRQIVHFCRSAEFSVEGLRNLVKDPELADTEPAP
jgi:regulator of RNase E activity RraA